MRASLAQIGPQIAGLELDGVLIDGRKKALLCAELGVAFTIQRAANAREACAILWTRHPDRALELALEHSDKVLELAALCGTSAVAISKQLAARPKIRTKKAHQVRLTEYTHETPFRSKRPKMLRRLFVLEPELYAYAREAAAVAGHGSVGQLVREGLWKKCAELVSNCPQFPPRRVQRTTSSARASKRRTG